jgi:hypothetical protein
MSISKARATMPISVESISDARTRSQNPAYRGAPAALSAVALPHASGAPHWLQTALPSALFVPQALQTMFAALSVLPQPAMADIYDLD